MTAVLVKPKQKYLKQIVLGALALLVLIFLASSNDKTYYKRPPRYGSLIKTRVPRMPIDKALALAPEVGGLVRKSGPISAINLQNNTDADRRFLYTDYLRDRDKGWLEPDQPPPCVAPRATQGAGCKALVNEKYKFIYIQQAHSDNSMLIEAFQAAGLEFSEPWERNMTTREIRALWNSYFVFTFVSNVWQQAASQFETMHRWMDARCSAIGPANWRDSCFNPLVVGDRCKMHPSCCSQTHFEAYIHANPQTYCLLTSRGKWAVDFIGHINELDRDLAAIVGQINARQPGGAGRLKLAVPGGSQGQSTVGCLSSRPANTPTHVPVVYCDKVNYFAECNGECEVHLLNFYAQDIAILHPTYWRS